MDLKKYGPWAFIAGGSEGIGEGYARKLAEKGFNLVLTARKQDPLEKLANDLISQGTEVRVLSVDLAEPGFLDRIKEVTDDIEVGFFIHNAGCNSFRGDFAYLEPDIYRQVIAVNVTSQVELTRYFSEGMCQRGRGGIILSGSTAGYVGSNELAPYCASKAFSRIFSESLWIECEKYGVDVLHLVIGFTATPKMASLGYNLAPARNPFEVAQEALDNINNGPIWIVSDEQNIQLAESCSSYDHRDVIVRKNQIPPRSAMS